MLRAVALGLGYFGCLLLVACSTIDSRIKEKPEAFASLSPQNQALVQAGRIREGMPKTAVYIAWGAPDHVRSGSRNGHPFEAWIYTTIKTIWIWDYSPAFYRFGWYRYYDYWRSPFWGPYPYGDQFISQEVAYKTAFFEGDRLTGWEYIR